MRRLRDIGRRLRAFERGLKDLQITLNHSLGSEKAGALEGLNTRGAQPFGIVAETAEQLGERLGSGKIERAIRPDFAQRRNVIRDDGTAAKRGFQRSKSERLIAGRADVDRAFAKQG